MEYCYEHGIVSGISPTEFGRDNPISRGDFVLMLYGALGRPAVSGQANFTDVSSSDYYATAIAWASANGLVSGISATEFGPKTPSPGSRPSPSCTRPCLCWASALPPLT